MLLHGEVVVLGLYEIAQAATALPDTDICLQIQILFRRFRLRARSDLDIVYV